ncbi:MAG: glycosyltransferase [Desulfococcaceae bacterium]|jgi:GT2 family glycosyltransferase|nr:glycosyltransferase [Desulfococcaceae bacterium]
MKNAPKLSIVFLNYNRLHETKKTAEYLWDMLKHRNDTEVIAVDNASTDGTRRFLQSHSHWLHTLLLDRNRGIAGLNEGFRMAKGEYILVLDDDSHPADRQTLDSIIRHMDTHPETGIVACRIENPAGRPVRTWHLPPVDIPGPSTAFVGCGFAIRRKLFQRIGWYPGHFFLYQNEVEVAIRVMKEGYEIYYDPSCRVVHRESPAGRGNWRRVYFPTRNTIWILRRYFPFPEAAYLIFSRLCIGFFRAVQFCEFKWYYKALKDAFRQAPPADFLPEELRQKLEGFRRQNSIWHWLTGRAL